MGRQEKQITKTRVRSSHGLSIINILFESDGPIHVVARSIRATVPISKELTMTPLPAKFGLSVYIIYMVGELSIEPYTTHQYP